MTNISKRALSDEQTTKLFAQLSQLVATSNTNTAEALLGELLGYEEQVMLAKRLATVVLLSRGASIYKTANTLHISTATATKIRTQIDQGTFSTLIKTCNKKTISAMELLETIDSVLHLGGILPHYSGKGRHNKIFNK